MARDEDDDRDEDELDDEDDAEEVRARQSSIEGLLRDWSRKAIEKGIEKGIGTLKTANTALHGVVEEVKLPREVSSYVYSQIDETKNVVIRAVAQEVRSFLENTDVASELQRALTAISFEIKTEIRFIPNEAGKLEPRIKGKVRPKKSPKSEPVDKPVARAEPPAEKVVTPPTPSTEVHVDEDDDA
jgi:hypothetical protein